MASFPEDLAPLLTSRLPEGAGLRFSQGRILSWDPSNFTGTIDWRNITLTNVPVLSTIQALGFLPGDIVGLLGWSPSGGVGSWWIIGKLTIPGEDSPDFLVRGSSIIVTGGGLIRTEDQESNIYAEFGSGGVEFGTLPDTEIATIDFTSILDSLRIKSARFLDLISDDAIRLTSQNGDVVLSAFDGSFNAASTDVFIQADPGDIRLTAGNDIDTSCPGILSLESTSETVLISSVGVGAGAANVFLGGDFSVLTRITSSRRYKQDIEDFQIDVDRVLDLRPRHWRANKEVEDDPETTRRHVGFIAEEVDELGLTPFVDYAENGEPDSVAYQSIAIGLLQVVQRQEKRIADLEDRLARIDGGRAVVESPEPSQLPKRLPASDPHAREVHAKREENRARRAKREEQVEQLRTLKDTTH